MISPDDPVIRALRSDMMSLASQLSQFMGGLEKVLKVFDARLDALEKQKKSSVVAPEGGAVHSEGKEL